MAYYQSLREYLGALDKAGKLVTIGSPINKDTQIHPLVWLQYRGLPREQRKAFLFTNVVDSRGRKYGIPAALGALGGSPEITAIAMRCRPEETFEKMVQAFMHPIEPTIVKHGPAQDVVFVGDQLLQNGGMDEFPVPIRHPGLDSGPIQSICNWVTKDPDTGIRNVGRYRSQVYAQDRLGIHIAGPERHIAMHWEKCRERGMPLEAAIVVGGPPNLIGVGPIGLPYGMDEYSLAGALAGESVELVKCRTVDLEVPANADIVIEGELSTEWLELEGPHGEGIGLLSGTELQPFFTIKCITRRRDPVWIGSLSYLGEGAGAEIARAFLYKYLRYDLGLPGVLEVSGSLVVSGNVIKMKRHTNQEEVWRALEACPNSKTVVAVDDDIDIEDDRQVWWAINTRVEAHRDIRIIRYTTTDLKPSSFMPEEEMIRIRHRQFEPDVKFPETSRLLINATMKWPYPPVSLPRREFMEDALRIWNQEGLPPLKLKEPWHSYELGHWPREFAEDAERAVRGEYYKTSEMRARQRVKVKPRDRG
ncbi:MAG: UbiD family decarboxylase [Betaproteobacteria bacterium]|nr:UbiD family decarboxylase [Betaproteobacteria bacterium]